MRMTIEMASLRRRMQAKKNKVEILSKIGLKKEAILVGDKSQTLVPVDTELLKKSMRVSKVMEEDLVAKVTVSYNTPYALVVHERLDVHHPIGQAKYLEVALLDSKGKEIKDALKGLVK